MPAVKSRKGAVPSTAIGEPYRPIRTRPKLAAPMPKYGDDAVRSPNSATVYDDVTGEELARFGDRADGVAEQVSVKPLSNRRTSSAAPEDSGGFAMPTGGAFAIGGGQKTAAQRRREDMARAQNDTANLSQVANTQYMQNARDEAYGAYGVQAPISINTQRGGPGASGPFVRSALRTDADYLQEQYDQEDLYAPDDPEGIATSTTNANISANARIRAAQIAASARTGAAGIAARARMARMGDDEEGGGGSGGASARSSGGGSSRGGLSRIGGHKVTIIDPATGNAYETDDDNEIEARRSLKERDAKRRGLVAYSDPANPTGEPEYLSPSQARLREAADDEKFKREIERKKPGNRGQLFPNFSDAELVTAAVDGAINDDDLRQDMRARGFEDNEIEAVIARVYGKLKNTDKIARKRFQKMYKELTATEKEIVNAEIEASADYDSDPDETEPASAPARGLIGGIRDYIASQGG